MRAWCCLSFGSLAGEDLAAAIGEHIPEIAVTIPADQIILHGAAHAASRILGEPRLERGFWIQVDVDVLDPEHMPAVDSPDPGAIEPDDLVRLLQGLAPRAWGAPVTVFDPDLDATGAHAVLLARILAEGLDRLGQEAGAD